MKNFNLGMFGAKMFIWFVRNKVRFYYIVSDDIYLLRSFFLMPGNWTLVLGPPVLFPCFLEGVDP